MVMYSVSRSKVRAMQRPSSIVVECTKRGVRCGEMNIFWCVLSMMCVVWSRPRLCCLFCCGLDGVVGGSYVVSMSICSCRSIVWISDELKYCVDAVVDWLMQYDKASRRCPNQKNWMS